MRRLKSDPGSGKGANAETTARKRDLADDISLEAASCTHLIDNPDEGYRSSKFEIVQVPSSDEIKTTRRDAT